MSQVQPYNIGRPGGLVFFGGWSSISGRALLVKYEESPGSTRELLSIDAATGEHTVLPLGDAQLVATGKGVAPDGSQVAASVDHLERWRVVVQAARHSGVPVELLDISDYTPAPNGDQITGVAIRWTDYGIVGTIGSHSDF